MQAKLRNRRDPTLGLWSSGPGPQSAQLSSNDLHHQTFQEQWAEITQFISKIPKKYAKASLKIALPV